MRHHKMSHCARQEGNWQAENTGGNIAETCQPSQQRQKEEDIHQNSVDFQQIDVSPVHGHQPSAMANEHTSEHPSLQRRWNLDVGIEIEEC